MPLIVDFAQVAIELGVLFGEFDDVTAGEA